MKNQISLASLLSTFDEASSQQLQELKTLEKFCRSLREKLSNDAAYAAQARQFSTRLVQNSDFNGSALTGFTAKTPPNSSSQQNPVLSEQATTAALA